MMFQVVFLGLVCTPCNANGGSGKCNKTGDMVGKTDFGFA